MSRDAHTIPVTPTAVSRRTFIKGVVAGSVALFVQQYARRNAPRKH